MQTSLRRHCAFFASAAAGCWEHEPDERAPPLREQGFFFVCIGTAGYFYNNSALSRVSAHALDCIQTIPLRRATLKRRHIMENFARYFSRERRTFLENISYEKVETSDSTGPRRLGCRDTIVSHLLLPSGIKFIFNRRLSFEPESLFTLSVSLGVFMPFDPAEGGDMVDWNSVNIVEEFTKSFPTVVADLNARTTLLIAQITSAAGGTPLLSASPVPRAPKSE